MNNDNLESLYHKPTSNNSFCTASVAALVCLKYISYPFFIEFYFSKTTLHLLHNQTRSLSTCVIVPFASFIRHNLLLVQ